MFDPDKRHARHAVNKKKVEFVESEETEGPSVNVEEVDGQSWTDEVLRGMENRDTVTKRDYLCEVCGKKASLTEDEAFKAGWDYPPFIGVWGIVSPRTCPDCDMTKTAYWHIMTEGGKALPEHHMNTVRRILAETSAS